MDLVLLQTTPFRLEFLQFIHYNLDYAASFELTRMNGEGTKKKDLRFSINKTGLERYTVNIWWSMTRLDR